MAERVDIDGILKTLPAYTPAHWTAPQLIRMLAEELKAQYARIDGAVAVFDDDQITDSECAFKMHDALTEEIK